MSRTVNTPEMAAEALERLMRGRRRVTLRGRGHQVFAVETGERVSRKMFLAIQRAGWLREVGGRRLDIYERGEGAMVP
jgi:hypothetical protein